MRQEESNFRHRVERKETRQGLMQKQGGRRRPNATHCLVTRCRGGIVEALPTDGNVFVCASNDLEGSYAHVIVSGNIGSRSTTGKSSSPSLRQTHLDLCLAANALAKGSLLLADHADCVELDDTFRQRNELKDVAKTLVESRCERHADGRNKGGLLAMCECVGNSLAERSKCSSSTVDTLFAVLCAL